MIDSELSRKILTIGSKFNPPTGGIEMVLQSYSNNITNFKFISSWKKTSRLNLIFFFCKKLLLIFTTLIRDKDIDIVHMHGSYGGSVIRKFIILKLVKGIFGKKIIYHSHGSQFADYYERGSALEKLIIKTLIIESDAIICLSDSWKRYFQKTFGILNVYVLNNIIPKPKLIPVLKVERGSVCKFLFLGLIGERKGVYDLVQTVSDYFHDFEGKIEIHVGGNGEVDLFEDMIDELNLKSIIKFHGWVDGNKKIELLNSCDVFILPSYNEGLPIAILEAMSYKMPVISTKVGGIPEIVENHVNGFLIEPGNKEEIYQAICYFKENQNSIKFFGEMSLVKVKEFFPDCVLSNLNKIYTELIIK